MKYHYCCPKCGEWGIIDWEKREKHFICHKCKESHVPPTPEEQKNAYVDQHDWPKEMGDAVYKNKGKTCSISGCKKNADTLDHRKPWKYYKKGTSYENLFPMCQEHNSSKGDKNYKEWLKEIKNK